MSAPAPDRMWWVSGEALPANAGVVVFGRAPGGESVCLRVGTAMRRIDFFLRPGVTYGDAVGRVRLLMKSVGVAPGQWSHAPIQRKLAMPFPGRDEDDIELHVGRACMRIAYPYRARHIGADGRDVWHSGSVGGREPPVVSVIRDAGLTGGPGWISLCGARPDRRVSTCSAEVCIPTASALRAHTQRINAAPNEAPAPPLSVVVLSWRRCPAAPGPAGAILRIRLQPGLSCAGDEVRASTVATAQQMAALVRRADADIVMGHRIGGALARLENELRGRQRCQLNRSRSQPRRAGWGQVLCDVREGAQEFAPGQWQDYGLATLARGLLRRGGAEAEVEANDGAASPPAPSYTSPVLRARTAWAVAQRLRLLRMTLRLARLCGVPWRASLASKRSQRIEALVARCMSAAGYASPDGVPWRARHGVRVPIRGGLVLDPVLGAHAKPGHSVHVFDFASMYPSLVLAHRICFTPSGAVLPRMLRQLLAQRARARAKLQRAGPGAADTEALHVEQLALKVVANSVYGCLAQPGGRFYAPHLAARITALGRGALETAHAVASDHGKVVYGDTDSVMVMLPDAPADAAALLCADVNAKMPPGVRLQHEAAFGAMIVAGKKAYAALPAGATAERQMVVKSMFTRRDMCPLAKRIGRAFLWQALRLAVQGRLCGAELAAQVLERAQSALRSASPADLCVTMKLNKDPHSYGQAHAKSPHIQAGTAAGASAGDFVRFVRCTGGRGVPYDGTPLPDGVALDLDWYARSQVLAPVASVALHLGAPPAAQLAPHLGDLLVSPAGHSGGAVSTSEWHCPEAAPGTPFSWLGDPGDPTGAGDPMLTRERRRLRAEAGDDDDLCAAAAAAAPSAPKRQRVPRGAIDTVSMFGGG